MHWTILVSANLVVVLLSYSFLAYALAQWRWRNWGGLFFFAVIVCGFVWFIPQAIAIFSFGWSIALWPVWFGNWLGLIFSTLLFGHSLKGAPRDLVEAAELDGCGPLRMYWHVVLPLVRRTLLLSMIFVLLVSSAPLLAPFLPNPWSRNVSISQTGQLTVHGFGILCLASLLATLPVFACFFFARRDFRALKT